MSNQQELGQIIFGNPTGEYGTPTYADALIEWLLREIERVHWNKYQKEWDRYNPVNLNGIDFRGYYWGEASEESELPNLKFDGLQQEIRWYKHPHRGQSCTIKMDEKQWIEWFNAALKIIQDNDTKDYV
jgi:hypothetical protein